LCNWGSKNFFSGGPTPKPEVELVGRKGDFVEVGERYQAVKTVLENSQGLPRYLGSKKNIWRHLAAKRTDRVGEEGGMGREH